MDQGHRKRRPCPTQSPSVPGWGSGDGPYAPDLRSSPSSADIPSAVPPSAPPGVRTNRPGDHSRRYYLGAMRAKTVQPDTHHTAPSAGAHSSFALRHSVFPIPAVTKKRRRNEAKKPRWRPRQPGSAPKTNPKRTHHRHAADPNEPTPRGTGARCGRRLIAGGSAVNLRAAVARIVVLLETGRCGWWRSRRSVRGFLQR